MPEAPAYSPFGILTPEPERLKNRVATTRIKCSGDGRVLRFWRLLVLKPSFDGRRQPQFPFQRAMLLRICKEHTHRVSIAILVDFGLRIGWICKPYAVPHELV